jgi:hypothetical protein
VLVRQFSYRVWRDALPDFREHLSIGHCGSPALFAYVVRDANG